MTVRDILEVRDDLWIELIDEDKYPTHGVVDVNNAIVYTEWNTKERIPTKYLDREVKYLNAYVNEEVPLMASVLMITMKSVN